MLRGDIDSRRKEKKKTSPRLVLALAGVRIGENGQGRERGQKKKGTVLA
jgi:hypothetical protein